MLLRPRHLARKAFLYTRANLRRFCKKPLTHLSIFWWLFLAGLVILVGVAPVMREPGRSWLAWRDWISSFKLTGPALLAGLLLKWLDRVRLRLGFSKQLKRHSRRRKLCTARAIMELYQNSQAGRSSAADILHVREMILQCLPSSVAQIIGVAEADTIVATLLDFSGGSTDKMTVVARSTSERPRDIQYDSKTLIAWDALTNNRIAVEHDVQESARWYGVGHRSYSSVIAIPIVVENKGVAALSIDSPDAYAFAGHAAEIEISLQPYIAVLALAYPIDSVHVKCEYDPTHAPWGR